MSTPSLETQTGLILPPSITLAGDVLLEVPFRAWPCTLNNFRSGAFSYVSPGVSLHRVSLGRYCSIGDGVQILSSHPTDGLTTSPFPYQNVFPAPFVSGSLIAYSNLSETRIGNDVWIGSSVRIKSGVTIGDGAIIGAGSVVTKDIPAYGVYGGVPAKPIRNRFEPDLVERLQRLQWWRFNLIGSRLPWDDPAAAVAEIERQEATGQLLPYVGPIFRVWKEGNSFKARQVPREGTGDGSAR